MRFRVTIFVFLFLFFITAVPRANAEMRPFIHAGPMGIFQVGGTERKLDPGAGVRVSVGGQSDIFGFGVNFLYSSFDLEAGQGGCNVCVFGGVIPPTAGGENSDFFGGTFDLRMTPLGSRSDIAFQPFFTLGVGGQYLTADTLALDGAGGFLFNLGFGTDIRVSEYFFLGFEGNYLPAITFAGSNNLTDPFGDAFDLHFFSLSGHVTLKF